jgi:hypothetical protein
VHLIQGLLLPCRQGWLLLLLLLLPLLCLYTGIVHAHNSSLALATCDIRSWQRNAVAGEGTCRLLLWWN